MGFKKYETIDFDVYPNVFITWRIWLYFKMQLLLTTIAMPEVQHLNYKVHRLYRIILLLNDDISASYRYQRCHISLNLNIICKHIKWRGKRRKMHDAVPYQSVHFCKRNQNIVHYISVRKSLAVVCEFACGSQNIRYELKFRKFVIAVCSHAIKQKCYANFPKSLCTIRTFVPGMSKPCSALYCDVK